MCLTSFSIVIYYILTSNPIFLISSNTIIWHDITIRTAYVEIDTRSAVSPIVNEVNWLIPFLVLFGYIHLHLLIIKSSHTPMDFVFMACYKWCCPTISWILLQFEYHGSIVRLVIDVFSLVTILSNDIIVIS